MSLIALKNDIAINTALIVDRKVTLDLVGYMLEISGSGSVIAIQNGGDLTLVDSDLTSTYYFTPETDGLWKWGTGGTKTVHGGVIYGGTVSHEEYQPDADTFDVGVKFKTADGYIFNVKKTVKVLAQHTGGTATCTEKAKCEVCHESYDSLDSNNHTGTAEWVKDAQRHEKKYTCCGVVTVASEPHKWTDGVCQECGYVCSHYDNDKNHICDICGKIYSNHRDTDKNHICDYCGKTISNHDDTDKNHICNYCGKVITNHTGGKATCKDKAVCDYCGKAYGELDASNHANLKHIPAKAATKEAEGNIEYWYCEGCDKYYSDAEALNGIVKGSILIMKLTDEPKSPKTGDSSSHMPWTALLFIGGVCAALTVKKKKQSKK